MANKYPYVASAGPLVKSVEQLRKSFPKEVTTDTPGSWASPRKTNLT